MGRDFSRQSDDRRRHLGDVGGVDCVIGNDHPPAYHSIPPIMTKASDGQEQTRKERRTIVLRRWATRMLDRVSDSVDHGTARYRKIVPLRIRSYGGRHWMLSFTSKEPPLLEAVGGIPPGPSPTTTSGVSPAIASISNTTVTQPTALVETPDVRRIPLGHPSPQMSPSQVTLMTTLTTPGGVVGGDWGWGRGIPTSQQGLS